MNQNIIIGTAGHVDHGKTALIKALTDVDCDTHKQEKERGITINLGFSHIKLPSGQTAGIIDMPGHKNFVKTVVSGAYGVDLVLLVISAESGIMPQTTEHIKIIELLGIKHGIVVINKIDLVDEEMLELATMEVEEFLENTPLQNSTIIPVSSIQKTGLEDLVQEIDKTIKQIPQKKTDTFIRMYIDRIFNIKGKGVVVTGSVINGKVTLGDELFLMPGKKKKLKVKSLQKHGEYVSEVESSSRTALNLSGLKKHDFEKGMLLTNKIIEETKIIDVRIQVFDDVVLPLWSNVILFAGTYESQARIHLLDKDTLLENNNALAQIHLEKPAILLLRDNFIFRDTPNNKTLGGGIILDTHPLHHRKRTEKLISHLNNLSKIASGKMSLLDKIAWEIKKKDKAMNLYEVSEILGEQPLKIETEIKNDLKNKIKSFPIDSLSILSLKDIDETFQERIINCLQKYHKKNKILETGLNLNEICARTGVSNKKWEKKYAEILILNLLEKQLIKKKNNTFAMKEHKVIIDIQTEKQLNIVEQHLLSYGMQRPMNSDVEKFAETENITKDRLKMLLKILNIKQKIYFSGNDYLHIDVVNKSRRLLIDEIQKKGKGINEKEFRLLINGSKKLVQVLVSLFEKEGSIEKQGFFLNLTNKEL